MLCDLESAKAHELICVFRPMICACEGRMPNEEFLEHAK
jgi:hypothetical protein